MLLVLILSKNWLYFLLWFLYLGRTSEVKKSHNGRMYREFRNTFHLHFSNMNILPHLCRGLEGFQGWLKKKTWPYNQEHTQAFFKHASEGEVPRSMRPSRGWGPAATSQKGGGRGYPWVSRGQRLLALGVRATWWILSMATWCWLQLHGVGKAGRF